MPIKPNQTIIDILIQPFPNKIKSYARDNIDVFNSIQKKIDPNTLSYI